MELAVTGTKFRVKPVRGVNHLLSELTKIWSTLSKPKILAITYTYTQDVVTKLGQIGKDVRVMSGKLSPDHRQKVKGVLLSGASLHFKGIVAWNETKTTYYIGSGNLTASSGGDWGLLIEKYDTFNGFNMNADVSNYKDWQDPFEVIFSEIVKRETGGKCEICNHYTGILYLEKGLFICENCRWR